MMKLKEHSQYELEQIPVSSFAISTTDFRSAILGTLKNVVALEMKVVVNSSKRFPYKTSTIVLPDCKPTGKIVRNIEMSKMYRNENVLNKQTLTLDPLYAGEFTENSINPQAVSIHWPPDRNLAGKAVAVVTNYGACEILGYDVVAREFRERLFSFNDCLDEFIPFESLREIINNFSQLKSVMDMYAITTCYWHPEPLGKEEFVFYVANAAGWIFAFRVTPWKAELCGKIQTGLGSIATLVAEKSVLIAYDVNGLIKSFRVTGLCIEEIETLWTRADKLACKKITVSFCSQINKYFIATCKGSHFIAFALSSDGYLEHTTRFYAGNMTITAFDTLCPTEYIITTFVGLVEHIQLIYTKSSLTPVTTEVQTDFDTKHYTILGFSASTNKAMWLTLLRPTKLHTLSSKHVCNTVLLSVSSLSTLNPLVQLQKIGHNVKNEDVIDCFVKLRLEISESSLANDYYRYDPQPVQISSGFLNRLRLKLFIINAIGAYNRYKTTQRGQSNETEANSLQKLIRIVVLCHRLTHIVSIPDRSEFQNLAGKFIQYTLKSLHKENDNDDETAQPIQQILTPLIDCLLEQHEDLFETVVDFCVYCEQKIDFDTLLCPEMHPLRRCSISCVQLPLFNQKKCPQCNALVLDDEEGLQSILSHDDELKCTLCGYQFADSEISYM